MKAHSESILVEKINGIQRKILTSKSYAMEFYEMAHESKNGGYYFNLFQRQRRRIDARR